jgi:DNA-binding NarL/FixJ family response regulator
MNSKESIRVLLADDHPVVMKGFAIALEDVGMEVVGQATTPDDVLRLYSELQPDVAVLDIRFGEKLTGMDVAKEILKQSQNAKIVFLSQFDQDTLIKECYRIGGGAFITKNCDPETLATAIQRVYEGTIYFLPSVAERLASLAIKGGSAPQDKLDPREVEIFKLMADGLTIAEMAEKLSLSQKTISNASLAIKEKLGIHRPAEITKLALKYGLIHP